MSKDGYALVLLGAELPARPGGIPRMQNVETLLEELPEIRRGPVPPIVLMVHRRPDVDEEDKLRWAGDMRVHGVRTLLCKPFRTVGRTPERVIKKLLAGKVEQVKIGASEPAPAEQPPAESTPPAKVEAGEEKWLTVTEAARLLTHDLPGLDLKRARSRISTAAGRDEFKAKGSRRDRRIEPATFAAWRLKQRDRDLDEQDEDDAT